MNGPKMPNLVDDSGSPLLEILLQRLCAGFSARGREMLAKSRQPPHPLGGNDTAIRCVERLLEAKADVNYRGSRRATAIHLAAQYLVFLLPLLKKYGGKVHVKDIKGSTPLHYACCYQNLDSVQWLLANGAKIRQNVVLRTPLHECCISSLGGTQVVTDQQALAVVQALVNHGKFDIDALDCDLQTALSGAAYWNLLETARFLLASGATVYMLSTKLHTPLTGPAARGHLEMCRLLVEAGACTHPTITAWSGTGKMRIYSRLSDVAAQNGHAQLSKYFLQIEAKVDVNEPFDCAKCGSSNRSEKVASACRKFVETGGLGVDLPKCGNPNCKREHVDAVGISHCHARTIMPKSIVEPHLEGKLRLIDESTIRLSKTELVPLKRCSGCQSIGYCCKDCQREHWPAHKAQCTKKAL